MVRFFSTSLTTALSPDRPPLYAPRLVKISTCLRPQETTTPLSIVGSWLSNDVTLHMTVRYSHLPRKHTLAAVERLDACSESPTDTTTGTGSLEQQPVESSLLQ